MNSGIYAIEHFASGRKYVGSAVSFDGRFRVHRCHLRKGTHHSAPLQAAWNKYGQEAFSFRKLLVCAKENLVMYEQRCIDGLKPYFNVAPVAGSRLGMKSALETREKIRAKRAFQVFTHEHRAALSRAHKGVPMPDGFGDRVREWKTGQRHSVETKNKMSASRRGIPATEVQRSARARKLDWAKATEIRSLYAASTLTQKQIALMYGLDQSFVSNIVRNKRWANKS